MTDAALYEDAEIVDVNDLDMLNDYILVINTALGGDGLKRLAVGKVTHKNPTPEAVADGASTLITMTNIAAGILTMATSSSGRAPVVPTGTDVHAVLAVGDSIDWYFINTGNQTATLTGNTGHTLIPTVIAQTTLTSRKYRTVCTAHNTAVTYCIG